MPTAPSTSCAAKPTVTKRTKSSHTGQSLPVLGLSHPERTQAISSPVLETYHTPAMLATELVSFPD